MPHSATLADGTDRAMAAGGDVMNRQRRVEVSSVGPVHDDVLGDGGRPTVSAHRPDFVGQTQLTTRIHAFVPHVVIRVSARRVSVSDLHVTTRREQAVASLEAKLQRSAPAVWLNAQEAAAHAGMSWPTLRHLVLEERIPHLRRGRLWLFELAEIDRALRELASRQVTVSGRRH